MKFIGKFIFGIIICIFCLVLIYFGYSKIIKKIYVIKYNELVEKYSAEYGLDKYFVYAVIKCESGFDKDAVSSVGAKGLMQITDETFEWLQTKINDGDKMENDALFDPETCVKYGCYLLSRLSSEFESNEVVLAAYHAGSNQVRTWLADENYSTDGKTLENIPYSDTDSYVKRVINSYGKYVSLYSK